MIKSPDAWRAYWRTVLWFILVVVGIKYPSEMELSFQDDSPGKIPVKIKPSLQAAIAFLGEAPPLSLWVRLSPWRAWLMRPIHTVCMLCIALIWQTLRAPNVLQMSRYLKIPQTGTLDLRNE
jgi:hypothetical protein